MVLSPFMIENSMGRRYLVGKTEFLEVQAFFHVSFGSFIHVQHMSDSLSMPDAHIRHYPMVLPPKPWLSPTTGGYGVAIHHTLELT